MTPPATPDSAAPAPDPVPWRRRAGLPLGPAALLAVLLLPPPAGMEPAAWRTAGVGILMAVWWMSEAVPIPATALVPLALFPLLGVAGADEAAAPYANPVIFLFLGGFLLAQAMQKWGLHRRIALEVIRAVGTRPARLVAGFMAAAALLSMWVSNTATAVMMLPIGISVVELVGRSGRGGRDEANFATALMLGIAYACSIGGLGTLIGTPPNALLAGFMREAYGVEIGFGRWMLLGVPLVLVGLPLTWALLVKWAHPFRIPELPGGAEAIRGQLRALGPPSRGEVAVAAVFFLAAGAWIVRPLLERVLPGLSDAGIAVAAALLLFSLPVHPGRGEFALDWEWAKRIPWEVLLLFGGGLSLAGAIARSGLAEWIGASLSALEALPTVAIIAVVAAVVIFLTELTSNTATAAAFLPVVASLAGGIGEDPLLFAVPAALAASCAFMLPVATPPNAIVYGSGSVTVPQMARAGLWLNVAFVVLVTLWGWLLAPRVL
jgi:sodium-dependent dicarboxylate transporter 2/3/5